MVIQLTIAINFVYSKDYNNEEHVLHSNSDNIKISINGKELIFHQKKMIWKNLREKMEQLLLMFCMLKRKKYILLMFQNWTQTMKNMSFF